MLPNGNVQQKGCFPYRALCAVIHVVWIAAFFSLTALGETFPIHLPVRLISCGRAFHIQVAAVTRIIHAAVPRPLISILPNNLKIEIGGITHERNQSAGLLPVLYTGRDCGSAG